MMNAAGDAPGLLRRLHRARPAAPARLHLGLAAARRHARPRDGGRRAFEKVDGGTLMTLTQKTFQSAEQSVLHNEGWTSTFNKLARLFE